MKVVYWMFVSPKVFKFESPINFPMSGIAPPINFSLSGIESPINIALAGAESPLIFPLSTSLREVNSILRLGLNSRYDSQALVYLKSDTGCISINSLG